jgi:hypothetical protein
MMAMPDRKTILSQGWPATHRELRAIAWSPAMFAAAVSNRTGCHLTTQKFFLNLVSKKAMARKRHPKPEIEAAIQYAEEA